MDRRLANPNWKESDLRVKTAVGMVEVCVSICAEGIRMLDPGIDEDELLEILRSRLISRKRH